jgi:hypothetical protein
VSINTSVARGLIGFALGMIVYRSMMTVAWPVHHWYERPMRGFLRRRFGLAAVGR